MPYILVRHERATPWDSVEVCKEIEEALGELTTAVIVTVDKTRPHDGSIWASTTPQAARRIFEAP